MANWWEAYPVAPQQEEDNSWLDAYPVAGPETPNLPPPGATEDRSYSGTILPFSRDASGDLSFDSNAGLLGVAKRAFGLPGEVYRGEVDPLSNEGIGRAVEMATVVSPSSAALNAGERLIPGVLRNTQRQEVPTPTVEQLRAASNAGYRDVREAGVDYSANSVRDMASALRVALETDGLNAELSPKTFSILGRLENPPDGAVATIGGLDTARKTLKNARLDFTNPTERTSAGRVVQGIDNFIENPPQAAVLAGPAAEAAAALRAARANHAAVKRSETLTGVRDTAELRAAVANSGQNLDNSTRQRLASLLLNGKASAGFNVAERQAIEDVARGAPTTNAMRMVGNLLGGGGGLGMTLTGALGAAGGASLGSGTATAAALGAVIPPAIGAGAKRLASGMTQRGFSQVERDTRRRSPLYEDAVAQALIESAYTSRQSAIARALLGTGATNLEAY